MTTNYVFNSVLGQDPQTVIPTLFTEVKEVTNDAGGSWANGKVYDMKVTSVYSGNWMDWNIQA